MPTKPKQGIPISAIFLAALLCLPFIFSVGKIMREYSQLKDVRFQSERLMIQNHQSDQSLEMAQNLNEKIQKNFHSLIGTQSEANAALQTQVRALVSNAGGVIAAASSVRDRQESENTIRPLAVSARWNGDEAALSSFLAQISKPNQILKLDTINIRRRQGTGSLIDVRMQVSALWVNPITPHKKQEIKR